MKQFEAFADEDGKVTEDRVVAGMRGRTKMKRSATVDDSLVQNIRMIGLLKAIVTL